MLVILVHEGTGWTGAIAGFAHDGLEPAAILENGHALGTGMDSKKFFEPRRPLHHLFRRTKDLQRLALASGAGIDFGSEFAVRGEHVDPGTGRQKGFPVLSRNANVDDTKPPQPGGAMHPAEDRAVNEALPRLQSNAIVPASNRQSRVAFGMRKLLDKTADTGRLRFIEDERVVE